MTNDLQASIRESQKEQQRKSELDKVHKFVRDNGINPDELAVFILGPNEMIIGEVNGRASLLEPGIAVKNPKRYLRLQQATSQGLSIQLVLCDLDALTGDGQMYVRANAAYWLKEQSLEGQIGTLSLYIQYFKLKAANKAAEAGLIVPPSGILSRG